MKMKNETMKSKLLILLSIVITIIFSIDVSSVPEGASDVTFFSNSTRGAAGPYTVNGSGNATTMAGGYVFEANMESLQKNIRWKAFVGNVSGSLTLDDGTGYTVFDWSVSSVVGEVYATRSSSTISWANINCSWGVTGNYTNRSVEERENALINHTGSDDNITSTFTLRNHSAWDIGGVILPQSSCYSIRTYVNDTAQNISNTDLFQEVLLYDGTTPSNGNLIYSTKIETNANAYRGNITYDFQMIVPENGLSTWSSSTPYYFYVELS